MKGDRSAPPIRAGIFNLKNADMLFRPLPGVEKRITFSRLKSKSGT
jgi:hypothetical protein